MIAPFKAVALYRDFIISLSLLCAATSLGCAGLPAGGSTYVPNLGTGSGPTTPFVLEGAAAASSIKANFGSWVDVPGVSLNPTGDWSIFIATKAPGSDYYTEGTVLSIGTASNTIFTDAAHLDISYDAGYVNPWNQGSYGGCFVVTGKDDNGTPVSQRVPPNGETFYGQGGVSPLVSQNNFTDTRVHGFVIQCRAGVVEFWSVDAAGARIMDSGNFPTSNFKGITNKPLRLCAPELITQPTGANATPTSYWGNAVQGLVIYNGGCLTPVQMKRLFSGARAQDVLGLQATRNGGVPGDLYFPGTITSGKLDEVVSGNTGTISGTVATQASILPATVTDDVIVDLDGSGQVEPRDPAPATTTKVRFWGTRVGNTTDIQMRVVPWGAPDPITDQSTVIVNWTTVATNVQNGQAWIGDLPGVPNSQFANYDCDVSWKDSTGNWTAPKRLYRQWSLGVNVCIGGQSILQTNRDASGTARNFTAAVNGYIRANYNMNQNSSGYQDNGQPQGWQTRYTPVAPSSPDGSYFGENRMAERLAVLCGCPVGVGGFAVGGTPLAPFLGNTDQWQRWKLFIQRNRPQIGIWGNGQGDSATSRSQRFADLDTLLAQYDQAVQTAPGGPWNYMFYVFPVNGDWGANLDAIRSYDIQWARSRAAMGKPVGIICTLLDESTLDGTHPTDNDTGHGLFSTRMAQTYANAVGLAPNDGNGPVVDFQNSTWVSNGTTTTVNLALVPNGGTALVTEAGGSPTGFYLSFNGGSTYVAPASTAIADATHITLTSATANPSSVTVTYLANAPGNTYNTQSTTKTQAGTNNAVYDNRTDTTGLFPLSPIFPVAPITQTDPFVVLKQGTAPPTPAGFGAYQTNSGIVISWTVSGGAATYNVKRSTTSGSGYVTIGSPSKTSFTDTLPPAGTTYYYVVSAVNGTGESANSSQVAAIPSIPTILSATPGNAQVALAWFASPSATSYKIYRSTSSSGPFTSLLGTSTTTNYVDTTAANGTTYYYELSATNPAGTSGNSSYLRAQPATNLPAPPTAPTSLTATASNSQVILTWATSPEAMSYDLKRSTTSGSGYLIIGTATTTCYVDTTATNGTTYYYIVTAYNSGGESVNSVQLSAEPIPPPSAPTGVTAAPGTNGASLSWTASTWAASYNVERATTNGGPYTIIATPTTNSFTDTSGVAGTTYYYVITAVDNSGQSSFSAQITYTVPGSTSDTPTLPPWALALLAALLLIAAARSRKIASESRAFHSFLFCYTFLVIPTGSVLAGITAPTNNTSGPSLGTYTFGLGSTNNPSSAQNVYTAQWLNRTSLWVEDFSADDSWADLDSVWWVYGAQNSWVQYNGNNTYLFTLALLPGSGGTPLSGTSLAQGATGAYNSYFATAAQTLVSEGIANNTIVRLGHEFNGNWYPWEVQSDADAKNYALFWQQVVTTMKAVPGASNLKFFWCGATGWTSYNLADAYPGNAYVDYVGCDIYDRSYAQNTYPYPANDSASDMLNRQKNAWYANSGINPFGGTNTTNNNTMLWFANIAATNGKPMAIGEWGVWGLGGDGSGGGDDTYFIQQMYNYIQNSTNNVAFSIYFGVPASDGNHQLVQYPGSTTATAFPNSAALFRQLFSVPPFTINNDIGTTGLAGGCLAFSATGAGAGYLSGGKSDSFHYASQAITGDTLCLAQITSISASAGQSGLMIRQSAAAGDPYAALFVSNGQLIFQSRTTAGNAATQNLVTNSITAPVWLKMMRTGNVITGYTSTDGLNWTYAGGQTVTMTSAAYKGLAISSGNTTTLNTVGLASVNQTTINANAPGITSAIIIDSAATTGLTKTGSWTTGTSTSCYGGSNITAYSGTNTFTVTPTIPTTGQYDVYFRSLATYQMGETAPVTVTSSTGTWTGTINEQLNDQEWIRLGTFNFAAGTSGKLSMTNAGAGAWGYINLDAVMFVPVPIAAPPAMPTGLAAAVGTNGVTLSWAATTGATSYNVARSTSSGGSYTVIASPSTNSYLDTSAVAGMTYYYVITAVDAFGQSANSAQISITVPAPASDTPTLPPWGLALLAMLLLMTAGRHMTLRIAA